MLKSRSFMDQRSSELHRSNWRQGAVLRDSGPRIFQIETTVNNNTLRHQRVTVDAAEAGVGVDSA